MNSSRPPTFDPAPPAPRTILIATPRAAGQLIRQVRLLPSDQQPHIIGVVTALEAAGSDARCTDIESVPCLGDIGRLDHILTAQPVDLALVSLPAAMTSLITSVRTHLRRLNIPERFLATLQDQLAGVGPRSLFTIDPAELIDRSGFRIEESLIRSVVTGKRVLVTGAGGSIGSELSRIIARYDPAELLLMDRSENALFEIDRQIARSHPTLKRAAWLHDVTESQRTHAYCLAARPEVIFHAAAHKHVPMMEEHPALAVRNNLLGTKAIADAAAATGCRRFVMISTDKAVNPASIMGATKRLAEQYVQHMNRVSETRFSMVRFGNVLASAGSVLRIWEDQIREGGPVTVTHPEMTRYFMTIPEAASLVLQAAAIDPEPGSADSSLTEPTSDVFVLDMGPPVRILDLARRFIQAHGLEPVVDDALAAPRPVTHLPGSIRIVFTGVRPGEKLHEQLAYEVENMRPTDHPGIHVWRASAPPSQRVLAAVRDLAALCAEQESCAPREVVAAIVAALPEWRGHRPAPAGVELEPGAKNPLRLPARSRPAKVA